MERQTRGGEKKSARRALTPTMCARAIRSVITRLDRLARSTLHLCQVADLLARKGVHLQVLEQEVDTHTPTGRLLFGMLAVIAAV